MSGLLVLTRFELVWVGGPKGGGFGGGGGGSGLIGERPACGPQSPNYTPHVTHPQFVYVTYRNMPHPTLH